MEVFQLQRFGLQKVNYKDSLGKIDGDFKYVPIRERLRITEIWIRERQLYMNVPYLDEHNLNQFEVASFLKLFHLQFYKNYFRKFG